MVDTDKRVESKEAVDARFASAANAASAATAFIARKNPSLDEQEEFDAEWRAQAPDATEWVEYRPIPGLDYREISTADWKLAGVNVEEQGAGYLRWDAGNDWRVPRGMLDFLTEGQFQQYILNDGKFRVVS